MSHQRDDLSGYYDRYWQEGVAGWTVHASVSKPISGLLRSQVRIFDVLLVLEVLQHIVDPEGVLVKLAEHVAPEGKVLISVPNAFSAVNRLRMLGGRLPASGVGARGVRG